MTRCNWANFILTCRNSLATLILMTCGLIVNFSASGQQTCYVSPTNPTVTANQTWTINAAAQTVTIRTTFSKTFVDNTYGANAIGWPGGHTFNNLVGSDHVQLALFDANGVERMELKLDYITASNTVASGYTTLGVNGGEGDVITGNASDVVSVRTSISENFNTFGYVLTTNSPATDASYTPNPTYPNWIFDVWYEVTVKLSAFGAAGFGKPLITDVHASPSKTGNNTEIVDSIPCPGPLSLGNLVWADDNRNGIKDATEFGACTMPVYLYADANNDNIPDGAAIAATNTNLNGNYQFSGLFGGNYIVGVDLHPNDSISPVNGGDPDNNIDNDNNALRIQSGIAYSNAITLTENGEPGGNTNYTLDFGLVSGGADTNRLCFVSPTDPTVYADINWILDWSADCPDQTVTVRVTFSKYFVDNTYGTNAIGWPGGHTFNQLVGSDHVQFALYDANNTKSMEFKVDYITQSANFPSGYGTLGVTGGEGQMLVGNVADVIGTKTSISENFNNYGYVLTTNSPATDTAYTPNPSYPNWIYEVWYEVKVKMSAFGPAGFGRPDITHIHASPSKTGNNTEDLIPGPCCETNPGEISGNETNCGSYNASIINSVRDAEGACTDMGSRDCCADGVKIKSLTVKYTGQDCSASNNNQPADKWDCTGNPASDPNVYIIANSSSNPAGGDTWFTGNVALNGTFNIDAANDGKNELSSTTYIHIYSQQGGTLLQTIELHTSCSQPLAAGDQFGSAYIASITKKDGSTCTVPNTTLTYKWESSVSPFNTWTLIPNATSTTYDPPVITQTTKYRRLSTTCCGTDTSNIVTKTVSLGVSITASAQPSAICRGASTTLSFTPTTGLTVIGWFDVFDAVNCRVGGSATIFGTGTTLTVSPTATKTYAVIVEAASGCRDTACVTVTVNDKPALTLQSGPVCASDAASYSITLNITGGTAPFSASATAGTATVNGNTVTISGIPSGSGTTVTVTDANGCVSDAYTQDPYTCCPTVTASASPAVICAGQSTTLSFTGTPGVTVVGWFEVDISGCSIIGPSLGTGTTLTVSPAFTSAYVVVVRNANNSCNDTSNCVTVTVNQKPVLTLANGPICDATASSYAITLSITGGSGPYTAIASAGTAVVNGNSVTVSGIPGGSGVTVTVTDANGCSSDPYTQQPYTCCPNITASASPSVICLGASSLLTFTGTPNVTVVGWFAASTANGGCTATGPNLGTTPALLVSPVVTTSYVVVVRNSNNSCNDTSNCVTVTVNQKPIVAVNSTPVCDATQSTYSITLLITGGVGPFSASTTAGTATVNGNIVTVTGIPSGQGAIVIVTDANGCSSDPCPIVPHTCCPNITASASPAVICAGQSSTLSFTGTPGVTVVGWFAATTANGGCTAFGPSLGTGATLTVTPAATSTYVVVVSNANGSCNDTSNCVTVTVNQRPVLALAVGPVCDASQSSYSITLSITGGTGPYIASATAGTATVIGNAVVVSGIPSGSGTTVTVTDFNGCSSDPYNQSPYTCCPDVTAIASPSEICEGQSTTLSFTGTPGAIIVGWFEDNPEEDGCTPNGPSIGTAPTLVVSPAFTTQYLVIVRNANSTCFDTSCVTVTVNQRPVLTLIGEPKCEASQATYSIVLQVTGGTGPYTAAATTGIVTVSGDSVTVSAIPSGLGTVVSVTDAKGCVSNPYNQQPHVCCPDVTAFATPAQICLGQTSTLNYSGTPGVVVVGWFLADANCMPAGAPLGTGNTLTVSPVVNTTYVLVVRNSNNTCNDTSNCVTVVVHPAYNNIDIDSTICEGETVTIGGNTYGLSGNYQIRLLTTFGCDSIINLHLTVNPVKHTDVDAVICQGEQIVVGGQVFTTSVTDSIIVLTTSLGCDSILTVNIQVLAQDTIITDRTICQGDVVNIGGNLFTQPGTYYIPFINNQCTGIVQLNLTVNPNTADTIDREICEGTTLVIDGHVFAAAGTYTYVIDNSLGCDSTITLNLSVNPREATTIDTAICRGEIITIGTQQFTQTGTYTVPLLTTKGCDSIITLNLIVIDAGDTTRVPQSICLGDTAYVNGIPFTQAGVYYIPVLNGRCTNIIELTLSVRPTSSNLIETAICEGQSVVVGGQTFTQTGTYTVVLTNSVGCDSVITLNLLVEPGGVKTGLDTTICEGSSVTFAGQTFSTTGTYQIIFPSGLCRDTLLLNLTVNPRSATTIDTTICEGSGITVGGFTFTLTGNYSITLSGANGCDSSVSLHLTVNPVKRTNIDAVLCLGEQVIVGNTIFTSSVTDSIVVLSTAAGCDSIVTVNISMLNQDTIVTERTICLEDFVDIGGNLFDQPGTYYIPFQNNQCTGIVKLILTVNEPDESLVQRTICEGDFIVIEGHIFSTAGMYFINTSTSQGCDSTIILVLTVTPAAHSHIDTTICRGETVVIGGASYGLQGLFDISLTGANGCDSIVHLNLTVLVPGDTSYVNHAICAGDSITVGGQTFSAAGTYYINTPNSNCSNVIAFTLTINQPSASTVNRSICEGGAVVIGNSTFNQTGTYTINLQNSVGCDSVVTLNLNVSDGGSKTQLDTTICEGSSITFNGQTFSTTGRYQVIFPSGDCRDTLLLNLTVNPSIRITIDTTICQGNGITLGGNTFTLTGTYSISVASATGCDSIITLNLTVNPVKRTDIDAVLCFGEQIIVGGQVFTTSVTDSVIVLSTSAGCDSIITVNLVVLNQDTIVTDRTICAGESVIIGGNVFSQAGTYYIPFQNNQCTGIVQLNLTVNDPTTSVITRTICEGDILVIGGQVFSTPGSYNIVIPNAAGCDSTIKLTLNVTPNSNTRIDTAVCRGTTVTVGGQTFGAQGTYTVNLPNAAGCDSIITLNLTILNNGDTSFVDQSICLGDSITIGGQTFTAAGTYYISTPNSACSDVIALTLMTTEPSLATVSRSICEGDAVVIGNQTFTQTGTYTIVLDNAAGCDSIITLNLNVSDGGSHTQLDTTICEGSSITFANQTFSSTGTYQIIFPSGDCRDTLLLNLTVTPTITTVIDTTICEGNGIALGGFVFSLTGNYTVTIDNAAGCDSIVTLNLIVNPVKQTEVDAVLCPGDQIIVGGQIFTTSVSDSVIVLQTADGCDSIITVNLVVLDQDTIVTDRTICLGDAVVIGNQVFDQTGTYYISFQNNQCLGIVQLNLTVNEPDESSISRTICEGEFVVIEGHIFSTTGLYTILTSTSQGCDSAIFLNLRVIPNSNTRIDSTICRGLTVTVGGIAFGTSGTHTVVLPNAAGCDSIITLNLAVLDNADTTDIEQFICAGDSVVIGGQTFTQAGTYYIDVTGNACTNVIALTLKLNLPSATTIDRSICEGGAVVIGTQTFTTSGTYTINLQNALGCDSVVTLNLNVTQGGGHAQLDTAICEGASITFANQTFTQTGTYQIIFPSGDCRDTLLLNLTVNPVFSGVVVDSTICEGETVTLGGNAYGQTGSYPITLTSSLGCDSIITLNLTVNPTKRTDVDAVICAGQQVVVGGQVFTTSVTDSIIVLSTSLGCDSIIKVNVLVLATDTLTTERTICEGDFVNIGGFLFDQPGTYYIPFVNNQCTGIVELILHVNPTTSSTVSQAICAGDIFVIGGQVFNTSGTYTVRVPNSLGCDSIITLNLTVNPGEQVQIDTAICRGSSVTVGTQVFNTTGTFHVVLTNTNGCDSTITLNLIVLDNGDTTDVLQTICAGDSIVIGSQVFTQAGTYYIPSPLGACNNIIALTLSVTPASASTVTAAICQGQTVVVGGQTFSTSGTHTVILQNSLGCDSIVTLILDVSQGGVKTQLDTTICQGQSVSYGGQVFSSTGTYQIIFPASLCRDTLLLNLTVVPPSVTTIERNICEGEHVVLSNFTFTLTGNYSVTFTSAAGCDSIVNLHLIVREVKRTNIDAVICWNDQIVVGGQTFNFPVTDSVIVLASAEGCDSIITLNLQTFDQDTVETDRTICLGDFVNIGGFLFDQAGTYYIPFDNNQCEGVVKLNLTVNEPNESAISRTICEGDFVVIEGHIFSTGGLYFINTSTSQGCDSSIQLTLTVIPSATSRIDTAICQGEVITVGGQAFNLTGNYSVTTQSSMGCDSIISLNLLVLTIGDTSKVTQSICQGDSVIVAGQVFNQAGVHYIATPNGRCSDVIELTLNVAQPSELKTTASICEGQAVVYGGQTFNTQGTHIITITNAAGCDSVIILDLFVSQGGTKLELDTAICEGSSITFGGQTFTQTGYYQVIYPAGDCRDTLLLNLVVNVPPEFTDSISVCPNPPFSVEWRGQVYTQYGFYTIIVPGGSGDCDTIFHLDLNQNIICPPQNLDTVIYDTIPVYQVDTVCGLQPGGAIQVISGCAGPNSGTGIYGTWVIDTLTGCLYYTAGDTRGSNDTMCISICDSGTCVNTTIIITVLGLPPIAVNDTSRTDVGVVVDIPVLSNDTTLDSDPLALDPVDPIVTPPLHGTVTVNPNGTITYTPFPGHVGVDSFQYQISDPDGADTAWVYIITENCEVPNAFSPNGDGRNEFFFLPCLDNNNPVYLAVWNRWGIEVYHNEDYDNSWDGTYQGEQVPDGTYYYVLRYINSSGVEINRASFLVIHR